MPGLCVLIQLGIVLRIAFDHKTHWAAIALLVPSFILIAYRLSVSASLAHRLTERTHELDRMGALVEMSRAIAEAGNLDRIMQQLADASARAVRCDRTRVAVFNRATDETRWFVNAPDGRAAPGEDYAAGARGVHRRAHHPIRDYKRRAAAAGRRGTLAILRTPHRTRGSAP